MNQSEIFKLNWKDLTNSLLLAVVSSVLMAVQQLISTKGFAITGDDLQTILGVAVSVAISYLVKNVFTDKAGDNPVTDAVGKVLKKK